MQKLLCPNIISTFFWAFIDSPSCPKSISKRWNVSKPKKSWRSLRLENFFHNNLFYFDCWDKSRTVLFFVFGTQNQNARIDLSFVRLFLPTKTTFLQIDNILWLELFFFLESFRKCLVGILIFTSEADFWILTVWCLPRAII